MDRPSIHTTPHRPAPGRVALAGLLVLALVWSQSLGLWHRVAHRDLAHATAAVSVLATAANDTVRELGVLERLFAGHRGDADCQFFDQHSHGDALTGIAVTAMAPAALPSLMLASHALVVALWHAQFQARGPPSVR